MHKLVVILRRTPDSEATEQHWSEDFVPLAERMPGLRRVLVGRAAGSPQGRTDVLIVHEFLFDDRDALYAAMTSPEGQAAGEALMRFAGNRAELIFAEHLEMGMGESGGLPG